jgi:putative ABC transport system permease protein
VIRLAARELRGAGRHVAYVLACVSLGVAALVAVGSFGTSLERAVAGSARALLGADVEIRSTRPLSAPAERVLDGLAARGVERQAVLELAGMARAGAAAAPRVQLVEVKAVSPRYPFYGALVTEPARPLPELLGGGRVLVHEALLARLGLAVGDRLQLGERELAIAGRVLAEPDRSTGVFSLGPRVLMAAEDLEGTALVQPGSRVRHRTLLRLPPDADPQLVRDRLALELPDPGLRISTFRQAQPGLRRFWDQLGTYLGLTGLVALLVGGIGVGVSVTAFVRGKLATIAVLKALGATWRQILACYLAQTAALGLAGGLVGTALGALVLAAAGPLATRFLPMPVTLALAPGAVARALAMGLGVTLLCALWPLAAIRRVPPSLVLRREVEARLPGGAPWLLVAPIAAGLAGLALWQAGSLKVGGLFIGGFAVGLGALWLGARASVWAAAALPARGWPLAWRQALANVRRPGSHAGPVVVTLGLAVMLLVAVALVEWNLREELSVRAAGEAPALFFIDLQADQVAVFTRLVVDGTGGAPDVIPVVRSRLAAIRGQAVTPDAGRLGEQWYLTREYVLTWAATPPGRNTVVAGRWWTPAEARREPLISVEEEIAKTLGVALGDTLTFDVQGVPISARVTNLRKVDWRSFNANFFVIFSPGALDGAPVTHIATVRAAPRNEAALTAAVVTALPNVTAIPVREVLERVEAVVDQIAVAVRLIAAFSVATGLVVLAGALSLTRRERLYQSVILRALGATRGALARIFALEYALLGAAAGLPGTALAAALAWAVQTWVLELPWSWPIAPLVAGVSAPAVLALAVGFLGTFRLLGERPLPVLRGE